MKGCFLPGSQGAARRVKVEWDAQGLFDPPPAATELRLSLAEETISCELPGLLLQHRSV